VNDKWFIVATRCSKWCKNSDRKNEIFQGPKSINPEDIKPVLHKITQYKYTSMNNHRITEC